MWFTVLATLLTLLSLSEGDGAVPNVVVLMADDLGIGDIGCFGNTTLPTPNIDRLCREGAKLTHHIAAEALCTPSRAAFLTGRYPIRMGLSECQNSPPVVMYVSARNGLPEEEMTWPKMLQNYGFRTAAVGKWHLGWNRDSYGDQKHGPLGHGFDSFYGLPFTLSDGFEMDITFWTYSGWMSRKEDDHPMHRHVVALLMCFLTVCAVYAKEYGHIFFIMVIVGFVLAWFFLEHFRFHTEKWWQRSFFMERYLNSLLMRNATDIVEQPIRLNTVAQKLTNASLDFIRDHVTNHGHEGRPFALYHSFTNVHTPLVTNKKFRKKSNHGSYGDSVLEMDDSIGQILNLLDELNVSNDTLVYFASDHGGHLELGRLGGSNAPFRGGKGMGAIEGGIRVPGMLRWAGIVSPGTEVDAPTSLMDFLPTLHNIIKLRDPAAKLQTLEKVDGKSLLGHVRRQKGPQGHEFLRHYCGTDLHAIRYVDSDGSVYKAYFKEHVLNSAGHCESQVLCSCFRSNITVYENPKIIDINKDPKEQNPIAEDSPLYSKLLPLFLSEHDSAISESGSHLTCQYQNWMEVMPRPLMQPCAGFPSCRTY